MPKRKAANATRETVVEKTPPTTEAEAIADGAREIVAPTTDEPRETLVYLRHAEIVPDPHNARKHFDEGALKELAVTIRDHGLIQPLVVAKVAEGHQLTAGERRWRAIGLLIHDGTWRPDHPIPCVLRETSDEARTIAALIENLQRVDLNPMEEAEAFERLGIEFHIPNKVIAEKISRVPEFVQQRRRLMRLSEGDRAKVRSGQLKLHEALEIAAKPTPDVLGPVATLALAEIYRRVHVAPMGSSWENKTECSPSAAKDKAFETLKSRRLVEFQERDFQTQRASIRLSWEGSDFARTWLKGVDKKGPAGDQALAPFLLAAGDGRFNCLAAEYDPAAKVGPLTVSGYVTAWLNGPFPLTEAAKKELERRKADKVKEKKETEARLEREKAAADARAAELAEILAGADCDPFPAVFEALGATGPFTADLETWRAGVKLDGKTIIEFHYAVPSEVRPKLAAALCALLTWCSKSYVEALPSEPNVAASDEIPAREPATTGEVRDTAEEGEPGVAASAPFERPGLAGDGFSQQMREARMASEAEAFEVAPDADTEAELAGAALVA